MKGLIRKLSKDLKSSKEILDCLEHFEGENKENLKRSRSLEAINHENSLLNNGGNGSPIITSKDTKRKLSGLGLKMTRKISDTTNGVAKRKVSVQPDLGIRKTSIPVDTRPRRASIPPEFSIKLPKFSVQKRIRKGSLQPEIMSTNSKGSTKADLRVRKLSVPANMKFHSERVRVKKVSFINQHTGQSFAMKAC